MLWLYNTHTSTDDAPQLLSVFAEQTLQPGQPLTLKVSVLYHFFSLNTTFNIWFEGTQMLIVHVVKWVSVEVKILQHTQTQTFLRLQLSDDLLAATVHWGSGRKTHRSEWEAAAAAAALVLLPLTACFTAFYFFSEKETSAAAAAI